MAMLKISAIIVGTPLVSLEQQQAVQMIRDQMARTYLKLLMLLVELATLPLQVD
ncbi:hypothetical protein D1872_179010 [compost metagenome]